MKVNITLGLMLLIGVTSVAQTNIFPSTGNVGIGTTTPAEKLTIATPNGNIYIGNTLFGTYNGVWLNGSTAALEYNLLTSSSDRNLYINRPTGAAIFFRQHNQTQMQIAPNGNVGIGTNEPLEKFQIGDRFTFHDGGWKSIMYNATWNPTLVSWSRITAGPSSGIQFTDAGNIILQGAPAGNQGAPLTDATHSLVVHNSGQIGIGTNINAIALPDITTKLFVEGGIRARKIRVEQAVWADFVFDKGYNLPSLTEVEQYIKQNKHLNGIPTSAEVVAEGVDLGNMQVLLLQKIEELTLYVIDLSKKQIDQEAKQKETEAALEKLKLENEQLRKIIENKK